MAANTSQRKAQTTILAAPVADYADWRLTVDCGPCGPRSVLLGDMPPARNVWHILLRMRCRSCGGRVATAILAHDRPGWRRREVRIWGPGSNG